LIQNDDEYINSAFQSAGINELNAKQIQVLSNLRALEASGDGISVDEIAQVELLVSSLNISVDPTQAEALLMYSIQEKDALLTNLGIGSDVLGYSKERAGVLSCLFNGVLGSASPGFINAANDNPDAAAENWFSLWLDIRYFSNANANDPVVGAGLQ